MTLIHPDGSAIVVNPVLWSRILGLARAHGWRPAGTLAPPIRWDGSDNHWDGAYEPPLGQEVSRSDARALADALGRAAASEPSMAENLRELAAFCRRAGFLVCAAPEAQDSLIQLAAGVGLGQPIQVQTKATRRSIA